MITIESLGPQHFEKCAEWLSNPEINRWLTSEWRGRKVDRTTLAILVRNKRNRIWVSCMRGRPCGIVGIADLDELDGTGMVWYALGESELSGKSITSKALSLMCTEAFRNLGIKSLYAWTMENNSASKRVLEKAGFRPAGRVRQAARVQGDQVDRLYFDRIPSDGDSTDRSL